MAILRFFAYFCPLAGKGSWEHRLDKAVHQILRFDRFALDLTRGCLRSGERDLELRPKAFKVLRHLLENSGRLVAKEELQKTVWGNVAVSDDEGCFQGLTGRLTRKDAAPGGASWRPCCTRISRSRWRF